MYMLCLHIYFLVVRNNGIHPTTKVRGLSACFLRKKHKPYHHLNPSKPYKKRDPSLPRKPLSLESIIKMSNSKKGNKNPMFGRRSEEELKQLSENFKGNKNPNWKNGITPLYNTIRTLPQMINWRNAVFKRDNYKDHLSGCSPTPKNQLEAHHITPFNQLLKKYNIRSISDAINCEALWDINNGITMLKTSHQAYHNMYGVDYE